MNLAKGHSDTPQHLPVLQVGCTDGGAWDKARHQDAAIDLRGYELGTDTNLGSHRGDLAFQSSVNQQHLRVLAEHPDDLAVLANRDLEVLVRDSPADRLDYGGLTGPQLSGDR